MDVEVRHLDPHRRQFSALRAGAAQQFGRQEMRAEDGVGREPLDLGEQLARVQLLGGALELADQRVTRGTVGLRVEIRPELRQLLDQLYVLLAVEFPELLRDQRQQIEMGGRERRVGRRGGGFESLGGADVAGAGGDTQ